jgi:hypothetical protein
VIRRLAVVLVLAVLAPACAQLPTEFRTGPPPACDITWRPPAPSSRGRLLLIAQSVPDATMIPCLGPLPPGWAFKRATVRSDVTDLFVETDTFDLEVEITLVETCELDTADPVPTDEPAAALYTSDDGRTFSYAFDGGCVEIEYPTSALATSDEGRALFAEIHLMPRDELRRLSGWEL